MAIGLFTDQVIDHFSNPRNVGELPDANGIGRAGSAECGDYLELYMRVENNRIEDVKFKVQGCIAALASSSMTTVLIKGKTLEEAGCVTDQDIANALGGLPEQKMHCSMLGADAIQSAIRDYKERRNFAVKKQAEHKSCLKPTAKVLVSCRGANGENNALAVGYCGNCSYDPPMVMVGIVPSRYSYHMIKESKSFVVNLVEKDFEESFTYLGSHSRRDGDKLKDANVKLEEAVKINAPILSDCPVNIECTVVDSIKTGSHEMFVGKVEYVHAKPEVLNDKGEVDESKLNLL